MTTTFSAFHNFRIDMLDPHTMGGGTPVGIPTVTPEKVSWQTTTGHFELFGSDFGLDLQEMSLTGTAHAITYSEGGIIMASAEGFNLDAHQVRQISLAPNTVDALVQALIPADNVFQLGSANDVVDVGAGYDVVFGGAGRDLAIVDVGWSSPGRGSYDISRQPDGMITITNSVDRIELHDVERAQFSDGVLAFDIDGAAGQAYRLYQAAFDRTPDTTGLSFWVDNLDGGGALSAVAAGFIASDEFSRSYGYLSDEGFVDQLYQNILGRSPDLGGLEYWVDQLGTGAVDRAGVLVGFAESEENVELVGPVIEAGIWLSL